MLRFFCVLMVCVYFVFGNISFYPGKEAAMCIIVASPSCTFAVNVVLLLNLLLYLFAAAARGF